MRISNVLLEYHRQILAKYELSIDLFTIDKKESFLNYELTDSTLFFELNGLENGNVRIRYKSFNVLSIYTNDYNINDSYKIFERWISELKTEIDAGEKINPKKKELSESVIPDMILKISPKFYEIYEQSLEAEKRNLDLICGLGYRKSFEFLLKDYLLKGADKETKKTIKKASIMTCIDNYVKDDNLKLLSKRIFWLGNDHAHYEVLHTTKTLDDLKELIFLTMQWIDKNNELKKLQAKIDKKERTIQPKQHKKVTFRPIAKTADS